MRRLTNVMRNQRKKRVRKSRFGPRIQAIARRVLVEMSDLGLDTGRVEVGSLKRVEVGDKPGIWLGGPNHELLALGEKAIEICTDAIARTDRALQPGHIGFADFLAKQAEPELDARLGQGTDAFVKP
jgi:hypothetical protein